jgi:hypothetical protein
MGIDRTIRTGGKTITQITAIVDKYVSEHPETWHRPATLEAYDALKSACPSLQEYFESGPYVGKSIREPGPPK